MDWLAVAGLMIPKTDTFTVPVGMIIRACPPDKRRRDLDNIVKPLCDLLEHSGVLKNDSLIHELGACWDCTIDKGTCEILLTSKGDSDG